MLLALGTTASGREVPLAFHLRFDTRRGRFFCRPHLHPTSDEPLRAVRCEPWRVVLSNGERQHQVLDEAALERAWRRPPLASRLGRALLSVQEVVEDEALVHVRIGIGKGALQSPVVRARLVLLGTARDATPLPDLLASAAWKLELTSLSTQRSVREHVARAVFLLGLEESDLLRRVRRQGLERGETLTICFEAGRGWVEIDGRREELPRPLEVARDYLEMDFVGAILMQRALERLAGVSRAGAITV